MKLFKTEKILHPFILFAIFLFSIFNQSITNGLSIKWDIFFYGIIVIISSSAIVLLFCRIVKLDIIRSSIFLTANLIFHLFFRQINDFIKEIDLLSDFLYFLNYKEITTILFYLSSIIILYFILKFNRKINFGTINSYLNFLMLVFFLVYLFNMMNFKKTESFNNSEIRLENKLEVDQFNDSTINYPDIYYFVLDAYTSNNSFNEYFNYDNSVFENNLRKKGFYIAANSRCNYNITISSFASFTNSSYLNIADNTNLSGPELSLLSSFTNHNQLLPLLKQMKYDISVYNPRKYDDKITQVEIVNPLSNFMLFTNTLYFQVLKFGLYKSNNALLNQKHWYDYTLSFFSTADSVSKIKSDNPKFLLAYSYAPHASFSFAMDENGAFKRLKEIPNIKTRYLKQVEYMNNNLLPLIDSIQKNSTRELVIIIHADHGSHNFDLKESTTILNAFYFSDNNYDILYDSISPVNNFRVILKKYFDPGIELLKDEHFNTFYGIHD